MKTFRWDWVTLVGSNESILWLSERDGDFGWVWGAALRSAGDKYSPVILNKERNTHQTIEELLSLKDAKEAIEKKLFDDGIIQEGDTVEDYTEGDT